MTLLAQAAETAAAGSNTSEVVMFWVFAVIALGSAIAVISMRNIVHGALMLVLNFLAIAGLYLNLQSSFLSVVQVLVYAGAIMVFFLFVVMLLGVDRDDLLLATGLRTRVLAVAGGALLAGAVLLVFVGPFTSDASICGPLDDGVAVSSQAVRCVGLDGAYAEDDGAGAAFIGARMFTRYTWPFELSALLLTVSTIGAVVLARRRDLRPEDNDDEVGGPSSDGSVPGEVGVDVHASDASDEYSTMRDLQPSPADREGRGADTARDTPSSEREG